MKKVKVERKKRQSCVYMCARVSVHMSTCECARMCTCVHVWGCAYVYVRIRVEVRVCVRAYTCGGARMCACVLILLYCNSTTTMSNSRTWRGGGREGVMEESCSKRKARRQLDREVLRRKRSKISFVSASFDELMDGWMNGWMDEWTDE